ncbi:non-ribosomal peptide synthetase [Streptomyces purpurogeneiscleroticus]|uniref:non-ribosomal peptide synthetase n=1 Tax=Streptomyces purpurogeneiscleroticus TaxID=68259 RepID=UPI001CBF2940|nr:non-ribosomal peptide synthetase [Streptomyces purpurogeneiscleroticus]MBZ4018959.1 peptide synthetase [Streptomyces purpurogeneiscleroticus]
MTTYQEFVSGHPPTAFPADSRPRPEPAHLADLLVRAAQQHPGKGLQYCLADDPAESRLQPYPELLDEARLILAGLRARGAEPGRKVALLLERPDDFLPAFWACLLGGMTACPLVPLRNDPERWTAQLAHVNALLDGPLLVTTGRLRDEMPEIPGLEVAVLKELTAHAFPGNDLMEIAEARPTDVALMVLTSGSTGNSKAVLLTHANLLASMAAKADIQGLTSADITLNWISYDHVAALLEAHLLPLSVGADQLQTTPDRILGDPVRFLRLIDAHRVTMTFTPNFLLGLINQALNELPDGRPNGPPDGQPDELPGELTGELSLDLSSLRHIVSGGEANLVTTGVAFLDKLAKYGLARDVLWPAFGMTETCAGSIYNREFPEGDLGAEFAAVGRPVTGLAIRIAAEDDPEQVLEDDAETGEVQLTGPMITGGYFNNAQATKEAFTADGWFRTGDLGRLVDGRLTLVGRSKDSIIVNGVNYFSHELEALLEDLDGVRKSYVAAFPTRPEGSDTEQLVVAFATTLAPDDEAGLHRLLIAMRNSIVMAWGFRPALLLPLPADTFPKTSLGKIQRALLRKRLEAGDYATQRAAVDDVVTRHLGGHTAPEGETEQALAEIYAELFDLAPGTVSATASFFDLGGTSLDILRMKRLLGSRLGAVDLPVLAILTAPSVRELAKRLTARENAGPAAYDPIVPLQTSGEKTPLFCVHPGVGEVLVFVNLAKYFVQERPFYALRARGFNPGEKPFESFDEMARTYAAAIRGKQPHGPYALAGYSFGSAVAFEIAKILEAEGERVDFLGSFNLPPHIKYRMEELDYIETAVNLAMFLELVSKQQAAELPAQLRPLGKDAQLKHLIDIAPPERLAELDLDLERFTAWADLADGLTGLGRTYRPSGDVRRMSVFYAIPLRGTKEDWLNNELRRWDEHTREQNRYLDVPGEHYTLMGPQHVAAFQAILRSELDRSLGGN